MKVNEGLMEGDESGWRWINAKGNRWMKGIQKVKEGYVHSLASFYLHTPTSTTISFHLPSSTSVGFHDSPEIIQQIVVPSHYSFLTNLFPCPLIFRHYTYSKIILHFRETYRILHCFVIQQGLNEVYIFPTDLTFWP